MGVTIGLAPSTPMSSKMSRAYLSRLWFGGIAMGPTVVNYEFSVLYLNYYYYYFVTSLINKLCFQSLFN